MVTSGKIYKDNWWFSWMMASNFDIDVLYGALEDRAFGGETVGWLKENAHIYGKDGTVYVECKNESLLRETEDSRGRYINQALGASVKVEYRIADNEQLSHYSDVPNIQLIAEEGDLERRLKEMGLSADSKEIRSRSKSFNSLHDKQFSGADILPHSQNNRAKWEFDRAFDKLKKGEYHHPIFLYGMQGTGKTHFIETFARDASNLGKLVITQSLDPFCSYLNPRNVDAIGKIKHFKGVKDLSKISAEEKSRLLDIMDSKEEYLPPPEWYVLAKHFADVIILDQFHSIFGNSSKHGLYHRMGMQKQILDLIEFATSERGAQVILPYTENPVTREKAIDMLDGETEYGFNSIGSRDLGSRISKYYVSVPIGKISREEYPEVFRKMAEGNPLFGEYGVVSGGIIKGIEASMYGRKDFSFRALYSDFRKIMDEHNFRKENGLPYEITPQMIVAVCGGKKAKEKLVNDGFDFKTAGKKDLESELKALFQSADYSVLDVQDAMNTYFNSRDSGLYQNPDEGIEELARAISLLSDETSQDDVSGYNVSSTSKDALGRLMYLWENQQLSF